VIDVNCDRDNDDICKKYFYFNGIWYATCKISRKLKKSLDEREDLPNFEELPEDFKSYIEHLIEESKSERALGRRYFTYQKMKEIREYGEDKVEAQDKVIP